jgi:hypothetical protein
MYLDQVICAIARNTYTFIYSSANAIEDNALDDDRMSIQTVEEAIRSLLTQLQKS